jgi:hypothetical protein
MSQPVWTTPAGNLGTIPEGIFYSIPLVATEPTNPVPDTVSGTGSIVTMNFTAEVTPTLVIGNGFTVTMNFTMQEFVLFPVGSKISIAGFLPFSLNGTYTVTAGTTSSVSFANTTITNDQTNPPVNPVTQIGTVTAVTIPFPVGSKISVNGFSPEGYNGIFTVTSASPGSISFANTTTGAVTTYGSITLTIYYQLIAGALPKGMQINETGIITGIPNARATVQGVPSDVPIDTLSKFAIRAYTRIGSKISSLADRTFTIEITDTALPAFVTPPGRIAELYDSSLITDLQIQYTGPNSTVVELISGNLPPGLSINSTGKISGLVSLIELDTNYQFTLQITDGTVGGIAVRTFSIYVFSRATFTADNTYITADNTFITADVAPILIPVLLNPQGSIGTTRSDNFFAYQFNGVNLNGYPFQYLTDANIPGLTLDPNSGWLYGNIPPLGINNQTYSFNIYLNLILESELVGVTIAGANGQFTCNSTQLAVGQEVVISGANTGTGTITGYTNPKTYYIIATNTSNTFTLSVDPGGLAIDTTAGTTTGLIFTAITEILSPPYAYSLTIIGPINTDVVWITPSYLGTINNGATSTFYVEAINKSGVQLQYRLLSGSDSRLPQGLQLLPSGEIAGRVSFNTFVLDEGNTIFDNNTTTFDMVCYFTVNAYSTNGLISVNQTFSIQVIRAYNEPYDNLYIQAMPPLDDRTVLNSLLQNSDIFRQNLLYRPTDPNFGVAKNVTYYHAYGLSPATLDEYVKSLDINHYWKNLVLGDIEVAQAIDSTGTVIYEVVYSRIIDNLVNSQGESVSKDVTLPYPIIKNNSTKITTVYPNSLINMRNQVIDTVGQISDTLPLWMVCQQANGQTLGFTPAWVIAYAQPGRGQQIAYYIGQDFIGKLNTIDFEVDRYELDNLLTKNWNREEQYWGPPHPAAATTFDCGITGVIDPWINDISQLVGWVNDDSAIVGWSNDYNGEPTIFDGNSLQFIAPVDMYSHTQEYDKYLVFPRRNILE